jgi:uncharacterized protein
MINRRRFLKVLASAPLVSARATAQMPQRTAAQLIAAARRQIGVTLSYDPAYSPLSFPGGDVNRAKGVCTDVLIRAYRDAFGIDLQSLINAEMKQSFAAYPKRWGLRTTDRNIDHRRVPNLQTFFARRGAARPLSSDPAAWRVGDIFTSLVGGTLPHIGIVSGPGRIIHNIGRGTREEMALFDHKLTGHYRWAIDG